MTKNSPMQNRQKRGRAARPSRTSRAPATFRRSPGSPGFSSPSLPSPSRSLPPSPAAGKRSPPQKEKDPGEGSFLLFWLRKDLSLRQGRFPVRLSACGSGIFRNLLLARKRQPVIAHRGHAGFTENSDFLSEEQRSTAIGAYAALAPACPFRFTQSAQSTFPGFL